MPGCCVYLNGSRMGEPWGDWISTRYEQKALREDRVPHYLTFRRKG